MNKLEEFNNSITSLQQEVENLQAIEAAYKQLAKLVADYDAVIAGIHSATTQMNAAHDGLEKQVSAIESSLSKQSEFLEATAAEHTRFVETTTAEQKQFLQKEATAQTKAVSAAAEKQTQAVAKAAEKQTQAIAEATEQQTKAVEAVVGGLQSAIEEKLQELHTLLTKSADAINTNNKKFYNEFSDTVQTRLDDNRMKIEHLISKDNQSVSQQISQLKIDLSSENDKTQGEVRHQCGELSKQLVNTKTEVISNLTTEVRHQCGELSKQLLNTKVDINKALTQELTKVQTTLVAKLEAIAKDTQSTKLICVAVGCILLLFVLLIFYKVF